MRCGSTFTTSFTYDWRRPGVLHQTLAEDAHRLPARARPAPVIERPAWKMQPLKSGEFDVRSQLAVAKRINFKRA
jgi:hypothetical protein